MQNLLINLPQPLPTKLNLGCGQFPKSGYLNIDHDEKTKADIFFDLNQLDILDILPENHFEIIILDHVLEHLTDVFGMMRSLHRVLRPGGVLEIRVPHFSRGFTHAEHKHGFDVTFPEYVNSAFNGGYIGVSYILKSMSLHYMIRWDLKSGYIQNWQTRILKILNYCLNKLANFHPYLCSRFWCYFVGGFEEIEFIFLKPSC